MKQHKSSLDWYLIIMILFIVIIGYFASQYFVGYEQFALVAIIGIGLTIVIKQYNTYQENLEASQLPSYYKEKLPVIGIKPVNYDEYLQKVKNVPKPLEPGDRIVFDRNAI
jgi:hypothetical protein